MSTQPTLEESFSKALHYTARAWRQQLDKRLKHLGIGQAGWMTIAMVAKSEEPMSQRTLASLVEVEGSSMVAMLDRLERDGLVVRTASPTDRRVKLVMLTEAGNKVYAEVQREAGAVRAGLLGDFDPQELAAATRLLESLRKRLEETP
ncbi:MarR family winged helix-turn-helix transcriptional regulator [Massilia sp. 9I]|uniref:MarR family winged helix-turn-helix transcriptional regulator n=1 Tax=Massilia sp. 9I TaxID=2653152 RepID=UPI0012F156CD|nr:MarR family transcriptional regulator [Massilia sp. 9I]VXA98550.1 putative Transcriptional regulator SlyA [Massilia sp. 9I]